MTTKEKLIDAAMVEIEAVRDEIDRLRDREAVIHNLLTVYRPRYRDDTEDAGTPAATFTAEDARDHRPGLRADLSAATIEAIRADKRSAAVIGAEHGISRSTVSNIKLRKGCYA